MLLVSLMTVVAFSCSKNDSSPSVSEEDAADAVGAYLASDFTSASSDASAVSTTTGDHAGGRLESGRTATSSCGISYDSTLTRSGTIGTAITYAYQLTYGYQLSCTNKLPSSLDFTISSSGTYSGPRISSEGSGSGQWAIAGFTASSYTLNGTYSKTETITQKTGAQKTFTSNLTLTFASIALDKSTQKLTGGTISFTMTGSISGGSTYTFTGSVTLSGNQTATITIGTSSYKVDIANGTVTKL